MVVVLVEGESDAAALRTLALRLGGSVPRIVPLGGSKGIRRALDGLSSERVLGLVDAGERRDFETVLDEVFVCDPDLESEFIRALGIDGVEAVIEREGELASFRRMQRQVSIRDLPPEGQLHRFLSGRSGNKLRYATLLAEAVDPCRIPPPLATLLAALDVGGRL
ncbi:MAG: ATP-dependent endonuclease [Microbacteriaceae bacterium]|nr:ATP-dependent endonuclease [Microbacteriaceae bacterium]